VNKKPDEPKHQPTTKDIPKFDAVYGFVKKKKRKRALPKILPKTPISLLRQRKRDTSTLSKKTSQISVKILERSKNINTIERKI